MQPLRIAFDVLVQLRFTDVEYAAALYAAAAAAASSARGAPTKIALAMVRPHVVQLVASCGIDDVVWLERAAVVRESDVLAVAIAYLQERADDVPAVWLAELERAPRSSHAAAVGREQVADDRYEST